MDIDWIKMVQYQQQMQKLSRMLFPVKQHTLTASECELLAWLYLNPDKNTPFILSQCSGMKKEAVSRCLKSLYEKDCIIKERQPYDERSYKVFLTETGFEELKKGYESLLQPFYDLWRDTGPEFEELLTLTDKIITHFEEKKEAADL